MDAVCAHDDSMAIGARKAFQEITDLTLRQRWLSLPFLGIDGVKATGQAAVDRGVLAATVIVPTNTGTGIEMLARALNSGVNPPETTLTTAQSFPALDQLARKHSQKARSAAAH
jgi:ABC-type sugar transport system substrate-binding protein